MSIYISGKNDYWLFIVSNQSVWRLFIVMIIIMNNKRPEKQGCFSIDAENWLTVLHWWLFINVVIAIVVTGTLLFVCAFT